MFLGLGISPLLPRQGGGDTTPGGASDVWLWESGIGVLWESGIFMLAE